MQRSVEHIFFDRGVTLAPVQCGESDPSGPAGLTMMATRTASDLENGELSGLIVPDAAPKPDTPEAEGLQRLIKTAREQGLPILALGAGVELTAAALGYEPPKDEAAAVLIADDIRIFHQGDSLGDAAEAFRARED